jgi:hypothetical protein
MGRMWNYSRAQGVCAEFAEHAMRADHPHQNGAMSMVANNFSTNTLDGISSFDLARDLTLARQHRPWQSGLCSKLLLKANDLRLLLIAMETGARMKEHHADGTVSIHALEDELAFTCRNKPMICMPARYSPWHRGSSTTLKLAKNLRSC